MATTTKVTIESCKKENIETIVDGINSYNLSKVPAIADVWTPLEFIAKDHNDEEIGGVLGGIGYWNGLEIKILWVKETHRRKGVGTILIKHVEKIAKARGVKTVMLDTFDFQAQEFYLKNGYQILGELNNFPEGHKRIYFSKRIDE
ncbi:GNAT family N-acetyltransferase [Aquimarina sp. LLG6339-5]|uniref:GNAT family N-acetyltransferase n=1 Tax=Aquimarina sp. LLG6339-5 TaxID=3160830 RepID=UPI00386E94EE